MNEEQLEDALYSWPLADAPDGFSDDVMGKIAPRQVYAQRAAQNELKFRLTWMDFALGIFFSMLPVLGLVTFLSLPQKFILDLEYQWLLLQFHAFEPVLLAFGGTIIMLLSLALPLSLRYLFPRQMSGY
jgi:hypothetical protein